MARLFWLGARCRRRRLRGAQGRQGREAYTPPGSPTGCPSFGDGLRELAAAVREGMAEREGELRLALGIDAGTAEDPEASAARLDARRRGPARRPDAAGEGGTRARRGARTRALAPALAHLPVRSSCRPPVQGMR